MKFEKLNEENKEKKIKCSYQINTAVGRCYVYSVPYMMPWLGTQTMLYLGRQSVYNISASFVRNNIYFASDSQNIS